MPALLMRMCRGRFLSLNAATNCCVDWNEERSRGMLSTMISRFGNSSATSLLSRSRAYNVLNMRQLQAPTTCSFLNTLLYTQYTFDTLVLTTHLHCAEFVLSEVHLFGLQSNSYVYSITDIHVWNTKCGYFVKWIVSQFLGHQRDSRDRSTISGMDTHVLKNIPKINPKFFLGTI